MNEELKKALLEFANKAIGVVNSGVDQIPGVLQDIVGAYILSAQAILGVGLVGFLLTIILFYCGFRQQNNPHGFGCNLYDNDGGFFVGGVILAIGSSVVCAIAIYDILYAMWFPRLVILDYLRGLL